MRKDFPIIAQGRLLKDSDRYRPSEASTTKKQAQILLVAVGDLEEVPIMSTLETRLSAHRGGACVLPGEFGLLCDPG